MEALPYCSSWLVLRSVHVTANTPARSTYTSWWGLKPRLTPLPPGPQKMLMEAVVLKHRMLLGQRGASS